MTTFTWSTGSGSWGVAANWGPNGEPTDLDTVVINTPGITVSVGAGVAAAAYTLTTSNAAFSLSGGSLVTEHLATFGGAFSQTSGTYTVGGMGAVFNGTANLTGGVTDVTTGALVLNQNSNLSGTLVGNGVLDFNGGASYIGAGFSCRLSAILIGNGARVGFTTDFAYTHSLTVSNGVLDLFGHKLIDYDHMAFTGVVGFGSVAVVGTLTLGSAAGVATLDNGLNVTVSGTLIQSNNINLGASNSGAKIGITKLGHYNINGNWNAADPSSVGSIANAGVLAKTGGGKLSQLFASVSSTGTLSAGIGELQLAGLVNAVSGTVSGAGTLGIAGGQTTLAPRTILSVASLHQQSGILVLNAAQAYAGAWSMSGGVLNLNSTTAVLTLSGRASFDAGTITGYGGTLALSGSSELGNVTIGGPNTVALSGTLNQTGTINFGQSSNPTVNIAAKAAWLLHADSSILGAYGLINNAGVFDDRSGSGTATVQAEFVNTGTLIADSSLMLQNNCVLGGTLTGRGLLDLAGNTILQAGTSITVAALDVSSSTAIAGNLADAGIFTQYAGSLDTGTSTLALSGTVSLDGGVLTGSGVLASAGQTQIGAYTVSGGAVLLIEGAADQVAYVGLGNGAGAGTLSVAAGGVLTVQDDVGMVGSGTLLIAGAVREDGTGATSIAGTLGLLAGGVLTANDQVLQLTGGGTLAGQLAGTGVIDMAAGTFALASGLSAVSAGLELSTGAVLQLTANQTYGGDFTTLGQATMQLGGDTLSLTGTAVLRDGAVLTGGGTLAASGSTTLGAVNVTGNAVLAVGGATQQLGSVVVGDPTGAASAAAYVVGGTDTLAAGASVLGNGTLSVTGTLVAGSNGLSQITSTIVDTGVIAANLGTLQILGTVTAGSTGVFTIGAAGVLDFAATSAIGLNTGVVFTGAGSLHIDDLKTFSATIESFATNDTIQLSGLNAASLTGTYTNAGHMNLLVSDGSNQIVLAFSQAQTLSTLTFGAGANGVATITHH